jgi:hypothetical protein
MHSFSIDSGSEKGGGVCEGGAVDGMDTVFEVLAGRGGEINRRRGFALSNQKPKTLHLVSVQCGNCWHGLLQGPMG